MHPHFPNIKVYEAIILEYDEAPDIMMVHGHQGYSWIKTNIAEKLFLPIYKLGLNIFGISRETNYDNYCKIEKTEKEFYEWVNDQEDQILIFGHTHRPLWGSSTHLDRLEKELTEKRQRLEVIAQQNGITVRKVIKNSDQYNVTELVDKMRSIINTMIRKQKETGNCRTPLPLPILFNTGCCIFKDGDITGLEIENGQLRLIKWGKNDDDKMEREVLESGSLESFSLPLN